MSIQLTHRSTSTSTIDLESASTNRCDSSSQTIVSDHGEDSSISYETIDLRPSPLRRERRTSKRIDQMTFCRMRQYSVGCWTKPARLMCDHLPNQWEKSTILYRRKEK